MSIVQLRIQKLNRVNLPIKNESRTLIDIPLKYFGHRDSEHTESDQNPYSS